MKIGRVFEFYGHQVQLEAFSRSLFILDHLSEDFAYFLKSSENSKQKPALLKIQICDRPWRWKKRLGVFLFQTRMCRVYQIDQFRRLCVYKFSDGSQVYLVLEDRGQGRRARLYGADPSLATEILFSLILSVVGEALDEDGRMRIHAAAFSEQGKNTMIMARSGAGKSTLFMELLKQNRGLFYSDEIALLNLKTSEIEAFPLRIALKNVLEGRVFKRKLYDDKGLLPFPLEKVAPPGKVDRFVFLKASSQENFPGSIHKAGILNIFSILKDVFLGWGTPQMLEFHLRPALLFKFYKILWNRCRLVFFILTQRSLWVLTRSNSETETLQYL